MAKRSINRILQYKFQIPYDKGGLLYHNIKSLYPKPLYILSISLILFLSLFDLQRLSVATGLTLVYLYLWKMIADTNKSIKVIKKFDPRTKEDANYSIVYRLINKTKAHLESVVIFDSFEGHHQNGQINYIKSIPYLENDGVFSFTKDLKINNGMGRKTLGPTRVMTTDILGLNELKFEFIKSDKVDVYPKVFKTIAPIATPTVRKLSFGNFDTRTRGSDINFYCTKEYIPGDNVKRINWKLSLKTNKTIVNVFENNTNAEILICLIDDNRLHFGSGEISSFEYCKDLILSLCHSNINSNNSVSFVSHQKHLKGRAGRGFLNAFELQLANLEIKNLAQYKESHDKTNEFELYSKRIHLHSYLANDLYFFVGLIYGKVWQSYFNLIKRFSLSGKNVFLILVIGYEKIASHVSDIDSEWIRRLNKDQLAHLKTITKECEQYRIKLSIQNIDDNRPLRHKIKRGFQRVRLHE